MDVFSDNPCYRCCHFHYEYTPPVYYTANGDGSPEEEEMTCDVDEWGPYRDDRGCYKFEDGPNDLTRDEGGLR